MVLTTPHNLRLGVERSLLLLLRHLLLPLLLLLDILPLRTTLLRRAGITILRGILLLRDTLLISILQDILHLLRDMAILPHLLLPLLLLMLVTLNSLDLTLHVRRSLLPLLLPLQFSSPLSNLFSNLFNPDSRVSTSNTVTDRMATTSTEVIKTISPLSPRNRPSQMFIGLITMAQCLL